MKFLLCSSVFENEKDLIEHYISYHNVDANNRFSQKLFQQSRNCSIFRKCLRCDDFLTTSDFKVKHDILKHCNEGQNKLFQDKPVDIETFGKITKYTISVNNFGENYNFKSSEEIVEDFLKNVCSKFRSSGSKLIKCSFVIENIQQSVTENIRPILNTLYWSTDVNQTVYFNDFVFNC